jgi:exodeoxyribonuclease V alpha subunit
LDALHDIQVISPFREKTALSCKALNVRLQQALNPNPAVEGCRFRQGDKVIQLRNDYERGIVNGDVGFVREISKPARKIRVQFENPERMVELDLINNDLDLAYCMTIHKSQGSEWPAVLIPIHPSFGPLMLHRNLLYTAVSRAKSQCIVLGHRDEVRKIVRRPGQEKRFTGLAKLLHAGSAEAQENSGTSKSN